MIPIEYHSNGQPLMSTESLIRLLSPGFTPEQLQGRYDEFIALNPSLAHHPKPDFSTHHASSPASPTSDDRDLCSYCGVECSTSKSRCGPCMRSSFRVYYCSKDCQKSHWPVHKPSCAKTLGVLSLDWAAWSNLVWAPLNLIQFQ